MINMAVKFLARNLTSRFTITTNYNIRCFCTNSDFSVSGPNPHCNKSTSLANLLQRYGFPPSQLHNFIAQNKFLLNVDLNEIETCLGILVSFKIPQASIVSLISDRPGVLEFEFLRKWETSVSEIKNLGVSQSVIRSVLEYSKRFQINPAKFSNSVEVLKGFRFSDDTMNRVLAHCPKVITMKSTEINRIIEFLVGIGIPRDRIERVLYMFPEIMGFSVEYRLMRLLDEFERLGFSKDEVRKQIIREPRILGMELGELSRCLELLNTLKCRVAIKEEIFSVGAFRASFEVKLRVDYLCKYGLIRREAFKILWTEPRLITYEIDNIEKKIEFLVNKMGLNVACLVEVPEYLGVNLEKQIVPRHNVIEYLRTKGGLGSEVGLKALIKPSRLRFYNLYVKPYPECEKLYGRFAGSAGIPRRHPVGIWKLFKPYTHPKLEDDVKNIQSFMQSLV